jgi:predicted aldo/keto reductase-like oxidoreductase
MIDQPLVAASEFEHGKTGCWREFHKRPLAPADCYRFVLSHPDVNVCVTAPSTAAQMEDNLKALNAGPLDEDEMARIRRIGKQ